MSGELDEEFSIFELIYKPDFIKTKIFDKIFINNNKKCKITYKNKDYELQEFFESIDNDINRKDLIIFNLKINNDINDINRMFYKCKTLISIKILHHLKGSFSSNIKEEYYENEQIVDNNLYNNINEGENSYDIYENNKIPSTFSSISKNNSIKSSSSNEKILSNISSFIFPFTKVTNMSHLFDGCYSLKSLPDISKFDTKNVTDMSYMFNDCSSLIELPNISLWNIKKVTNISFMFRRCFSLKYLPDLSKWDTKNIIVCS